MVIGSSQISSSLDDSSGQQNLGTRQLVDLEDASESAGDLEQPNQMDSLNLGYDGLSSRGRRENIGSENTEGNMTDFVDGLVGVMKLTPDQASKLLQITEWGSKLERGDLMIRLSSNANVYRNQNLLEDLLRKEIAVTAVLSDVQRMLEMNWQMSETQKQTLLAVAKDIVFNPKCTDYTKCSSRLRQSLEELEEFKFIFGNPHRTRIMDGEITKMSGIVLDQFRKAIKVVTLGKDRLSLDEAVDVLAGEFLLGGTDEVKLEHTIHVAILRRIARENPQAISYNAEGVVDDDSDDEGSQTTEVDEGKSKPSKTLEGTLPAGQDWWSRVDTWFMIKKIEWGVSTDRVYWKHYILETFGRELRLGETVSRDILPLGPIVTMTHHNDNDISFIGYSPSPSSPSAHSSNRPIYDHNEGRGTLISSSSVPGSEEIDFQFRLQGEIAEQRQGSQDLPRDFSPDSGASDRQSPIVPPFPLPTPSLSDHSFGGRNLESSVANLTYWGPNFEIDHSQGGPAAGYPPSNWFTGGPLVGMTRSPTSSEIANDGSNMSTPSQSSGNYGQHSGRHFILIDFDYGAAIGTELQGYSSFARPTFLFSSVRAGLLGANQVNGNRGQIPSTGSVELLTGSIGVEGEVGLRRGESIS